MVVANSILRYSINESNVEAKAKYSMEATSQMHFHDSFILILSKFNRATIYFRYYKYRNNK